MTADTFEKTWAELCAYMISVWHRNINELDEAAGLKLLGSLPIEAVEDAVYQLAELGGEYLPPWSQIYAKASAIAKDLHPVLPPPDMTRPLSGEEQARASRMGALLKGAGVKAIEESCLTFAQHAARRVAGPKLGTFKLERCPACERVARVVHEGGRQSDFYATLEPDCCPVGRPLYAAWRLAVNSLVRQAFHPLEKSA